MNILVVEDEQDRINAFTHNNPNDNFVFTASPIEAIELLRTNKYDAVCLDHDLGTDPISQLDINTMLIVDWMRKEWSEKWNDDCFIIIHSLNRPAREGMILTLRNVQCHVMAIPFAWTKPKLFDCLKGLE